MNAQKRHSAIKQLEAKVEKENPWYSEYDTNMQMLRTLRKEESESVAKS